MCISFGGSLAVGPSWGHTSSRLVLQSSNRSITPRSCICVAGWSVSVEFVPMEHCPGQWFWEYHEPLQCMEKHYASVEIMIFPPPPLFLVVSTTTTTKHINNPGKDWVAKVCNITRVATLTLQSVCLKFS